MINSDKILQRPGVIAKLQQRVPDADITISHDFLAISHVRRAAAAQAYAQKLARPSIPKAILEIFSLRATPYMDFAKASKMVNGDFAVKGDDLREATLKFMDDHAIKRNDLNLTADEIESLKYIAPPGKGYQRQYKLS